MSSLDTQRPEELGRPSEEWALAQTATVRCAFCDWTFTGPAGDGIMAGRAHRLEQHAIDQQPRRKAQRRRGSPIVAGLNQDVRENLLRARAEGAAQHTGRITPTSATPNRPEETPMPQPKQWPPDKIILALQEFHQQHGRGPTSAELGTQGLPGKATVSREFGGLIPALDAARVPRPDTFQEPASRPMCRLCTIVPATHLAPRGRYARLCDECYDKVRDGASAKPAPRLTAVPAEARSPEQGTIVDLAISVEQHRSDVARLEHELAEARKGLRTALSDLNAAIERAAA